MRPFWCWLWYGGHYPKRVGVLNGTSTFRCSKCGVPCNLGFLEPRRKGYAE